MSKAKELATKLRDLIKNSNHIVSDGADIMSWDWYDFDPLIKAVLSEPEPELKGWIENVDITGARTLLHLPTGNYVKEILEIEWPSENGMKAMYQTFRGVVCFYDSYDSIKQKIKEAS